MFQFIIKKIELLENQKDTEHLKIIELRKKLEETDPVVFSSLKEKLKYFHPGFHSTTPEGLNSRLTFLNQCMRPGQTIPVIGPDGNPKYNDALNTAFGAPPVLVLRIGDFYHTKIIPNGLSISYDPLIMDCNEWRSVIFDSLSSEEILDGILHW